MISGMQFVWIAGVINQEGQYLTVDGNTLMIKNAGTNVMLIDGLVKLQPGESLNFPGFPEDGNNNITAHQFNFQGTGTSVAYYFIKKYQNNLHK